MRQQKEHIILHSFPGKSAQDVQGKDQLGNALFLILIAVALFAALSYAVTQSGRGGGGIGREQARLHAAQMLQQAAQMQSVITRLRTVGGCSERMISFQAGASTDYQNTAAPADNSCHVFHENGGGLSPLRTPAGSTTNGAGYRTYGYAGTYRLAGIGTGNSDLFMAASDLTEDVCAQINSLLGIASIGIRSGNPSPNRFNGSYDDSAPITFDTTASGRAAACIRVAQMGGQAFGASDVTNPSYVFYSALIER